MFDQPDAKHAGGWAAGVIEYSPNAELDDAGPALNDDCAEEESWSLSDDADKISEDQLDEMSPENSEISRGEKMINRNVVVESDPNLDFPSNVEIGGAFQNPFRSETRENSFGDAQDHLQTNPDHYRQLLQSAVAICQLDHVAGSGAVISQKHRLVITNYHVVRDVEHFEICFPDIQNDRAVQDPVHYYGRSKKLPGKVIAKNPELDLALIQVELIPEGTKPLALSLSSPLPGQCVSFVGNGVAVKAMFAYVEGKVRAVARHAHGYDNSEQQVDALEVISDLPTNDGDSGAAIVNSRGELVAVNHSHSLNGRDISFATDVTEVRKFLIESGWGSL